MATMNISLPEQMRVFIQEQVDSGHYANSSDYVRDLVRKAQQDKNKLYLLQASITQGLNSGVSQRSVAEVIADAQTKINNQ